MKDSDIIRAQVLKVVNSQMKSNDPPETNLTFQRLLKKGYDEKTAKHMIGQCVAVEIFTILKTQKPFDKERFVKNLKRLPEIPGD